ncbi:HdeD family acid-resistance protein [Methanoculleus sp.]|uniref:HdeD family acid-resistance protein n=1 Tax=Methanoculleus sp. TaxID=90427 RepID=UPI002FC90AE6
MVNTQFGAGTYESGTALAPSRWLVLLLGVIAVILGVLFFIYPILTLEILVTLLGLYWLANGIIALIDLFRDKTGRGWKLVVAVLGILAGVLVLAYPLYSAILVPTVFAIIIGVEGLIIGAIYLVQGFSGAGWGAAILGILSIIFGLVLVANPLVAALGLVLLLAVLAIVGGIAAIVISFRLPG